MPASAEDNAAKFPDERPVARIGMLTPSSNTVLEPVTSNILGGFDGDASAHFGRFRVTEISLSERSQSQFDIAPILQAAELLADANVDVIAWNGTSSAWLGLDKDVALARAIETATGIATTTTMIAYERLFEAASVARIGLVTPYLGEIQDRIIANYAARGIEVVAERHLEDRGNFSFCSYGEAEIAALVREVAKAKPQMIAIVCTNFRGAGIAASIERECGIPVVDSVSITAWATARLAGLDTARITGWGQLFSAYPDVAGLRPMADLERKTSAASPY